ncbi:MAG: hypothetical protein QM817_30495 [Archangium sp.]
MIRHLLVPLALLLPLFPAFEFEDVASAVPASVSKPAEPQPHEPGELALSTTKVVIFKDGHGLFIKTARGVADASGRVFTEKVPEQAVLGTFWAVPDDRPLRSTIASWHESVKARSEERSCLSTLELLRANEGKKLTLAIGEHELTVKVIDVLEASGTAAAPETEGVWEKEVQLRGAELVTVETSEGVRQVLPVSSIRTVAGRDLNTHCVERRELAKRARRLTFDFGPEAANKAVSLHVMYFTPGVRWIPTYRVKTGKGAKAEVSLQAEILNEEEDFESATVDLVVGVPSFKFASTVSPLALEQTMRSTLAQAMPSLMLNNYGLSNANFDVRSGERSSEARAGTQSTELNSVAAQLGGENKQDFFVYPVKGLSLARGARAVVPLWKREVPQRHVYTAELTDDGMARNVGTLQQNIVMHQLELTNDTDLPFTTGAAMVTDGDLPLGQDVLAYTSSGGKTLLPITTALNLRAVMSSTELQRTPNATTIDGRLFTQLARRTKVTLSNLDRTPVTLRLSVNVTGKVSNVTMRGDANQLETYDRVNSHGTVSWEVTLAPGARLEVAYDATMLL